MLYFNSDEVADSQDIHLKYKAGKGLVITLTPEGGLHGERGVVYTRWGKMTCPTGAKLIYEGIAGAGWYNHKGDGANYLCMVKDPTYLSTANPHAPSLLYGAEYETVNRVFSGTTQNFNVPCAVCQAPRISKLMVPGKTACPDKWTREYYGYLMASHHNHYQTINYECVDASPDVIPGSQGNTDGALFYFVNTVCGRGLPCAGDKYITNRAVTCAMCTQ